MNARHLKHFLQVAELGSFSKASVVLHIAQPALSRQMAQLEHDLGKARFVRSDKGVVLTEAGKLFQARAQDIVRQLDNLRVELHADAAVPRGTVNVVLPPRRTAGPASTTRAANPASPSSPSGERMTLRLHAPEPIRRVPTATDPEGTLAVLISTP